MADTAVPATTPVPRGAEPPLTLGERLGRLVGVLVAPVQTFNRIASRPTWVAPLVLWMVLSAGVGFIVTPRLDMQAALRERMARAGTEVSDEQMQRVLAAQERFRPFAYAVVVVSPIATGLVVALLFWGAFSVAGAKALSYRQSFGVTLHAFIPQILASVALGALVWPMDKVNPNQLGDLLCSSPACFAGSDLSPVVHALLQSLDIYVFWTLILLVIGYATAAKVSRGMATGIVGGVWIVYVIAKVALSGLFG
ncbi:MAG: YIP1 family protein [Acidobacteriota bacterium]|nr:YIP1 family protein [Acidobacteriota bacterium]